jgi:hypothetical protein
MFTMELERVRWVSRSSAKARTQGHDDTSGPYQEACYVMKEVIVALGKVKQETNKPVLDRPRFIGRVATILSRPTF